MILILVHYTLLVVILSLFHYTRHPVAGAQWGCALSRTVATAVGKVAVPRQPSQSPLLGCRWR
eukprot:SAG11_NODE_2844_length_2914_cov_1.684192_2_plen_63_part_00